MITKVNNYFFSGSLPHSLYPAQFIAQGFLQARIHSLRKVSVFSPVLIWLNCSIVEFQFEELNTSSDMFETCLLQSGLGSKGPGHKMEGVLSVSDTVM